MILVVIWKKWIDFCQIVENIFYLDISGFDIKHCHVIVLRRSKFAIRLSEEKLVAQKKKKKDKV